MNKFWLQKYLQYMHYFQSQKTKYILNFNAISLQHKMKMKSTKKCKQKSAAPKI